MKLIWLLLTALAVTQLGCAHTGQPMETGTLSGKVVDERAIGIENARVTVSGTSRRSVFSEEQLTHFDGSFLFAKVPPGVYNVSVRATGYQGCFHDGVRVEEDRAARVQLALSEAPVRMLVSPTFDPREPSVLLRGSIRGRFVNPAGYGVDSAYVTVSNDLHRYVGRTGRDGYFLISGIPIGTYGVGVRVGEFVMSRVGVSVREGEVTTVEFKRRSYENYR